VNLLKRTKILFDRRIKAKDACLSFLGVLDGAPLVTLSRAVHTAVFAPTGVGKGVSLVMPFLMSSSDSCVVSDLKGDLATSTAQLRVERFEHRAAVLDPFCVVTKSPDTFNPLDFIDRNSPNALDDCRDLAKAMVVRTGEEKERHWDDSAEIWLTGLIALTVYYGSQNDRSLQTVRRIITDQQRLDASLRLMCESDACGGLLARVGSQLTQFKDKELASVMTTVNRHMAFLDTPAVVASTLKSSFDPAELRGGKLTVYLVLPPDHVRAQSALLRLWVGSTLRSQVKGGLQEAVKVHFVLDEAASLGRMECLEDAVDKYRGYGVRLQFYYQSIGQLKKAWPEGQDQTLLANTSQVFFGVNDHQTAQYVSDRLGDGTIMVTNFGSNAGGSRQKSTRGQPSSNEGASWGTSTNNQQAARRLLKPEEVAGLDPRVAITFTPGARPIASRLIRYYEEPDFGRGNGGWKRAKQAFRVLALSALVLAVAAFFALCVTGIWVGRAEEASRQRQFP
jgi:type IV secretion system protein VirD4